MSDDNEFLRAFRGRFVGVLQWDQLAALWRRVAERADIGWYVYAVGEEPPHKPVSPQELVRFMSELDALLRRDHEHDYCGIVYTDSTTTPGFVKVFDPHNLGSVCGSIGHPVLPGWILSTLLPCDLPAALPPPANRRRWWQRLFVS